MWLLLASTQLASDFEVYKLHSCTHYIFIGCVLYDILRMGRNAPLFRFINLFLGCFQPRQPSFVMHKKCGHTDCHFHVHTPQAWHWSTLCVTHWLRTMQTNFMLAACAREEEQPMVGASWYAFRSNLARQIWPAVLRGAPYTHTCFWFIIKEGPDEHLGHLTHKTHTVSFCFFRFTLLNFRNSICKVS